MKKFKVYIEYPFCGVKPEEETLEFDDNATMEQIEKECADCLEVMMSNNLDMGWYEVDEEEES